MVESREFVNDADYPVKRTIGGKAVYCEFYKAWRQLIHRCTNKTALKLRPNYKDCTVSPDFLYFSSFSSWMKTQNYKGMQLDKDLMVPFNTEYSPAKCMFVPHEVNTLFLDRGNKRGKYLLGVTKPYNDAPNNYMARCGFSGKRKALGLFKTESAAYEAYAKFKFDHCMVIAEKYKHDQKIFNAILLNANLILDGVHG